MKDKIKKAFSNWIIRAIHIVILFLIAYIVALIIPDTITPIIAERIGYGILGLIIFLVLTTEFFISLNDEEKKALVIQGKVSKKIINKLEKELTELKNR